MNFETTDVSGLLVLGIFAFHSIVCEKTSLQRSKGEITNIQTKTSISHTNQCDFISNGDGREGGRKAQLFTALIVTFTYLFIFNFF